MDTRAVLAQKRAKLEELRARRAATRHVFIARCVQQKQARLALEAENKALKAKNEALEAENKSLKEQLRIELEFTLLAN